MRLDGLGTSLLLASSSPAFGLAVRSCSYSRTFACCFFQPGPHGIGLAVQLSLLPSVRTGSFHPGSSCPRRAHECGSPLPLFPSAAITDHQFQSHPEPSSCAWLNLGIKPVSPCTCAP